MSYRTIDMQVSIPRVAEVTPLQQQQQHRSANEQATLGQHAQKTTEQNASRLVQTEKTENRTIADDQSRGGQQGQSPRKRSQSQSNKEAPGVSEHPYKGKHIDYSG